MYLNKLFQGLQLKELFAVQQMVEHREELCACTPQQRIKLLQEQKSGTETTSRPTQLATKETGFTSEKMCRKIMQMSAR